MKPTFALAAATFALLSAPAMAKDFSGPSIGVQAGWNNTDVRQPGTISVPGVARSKDSFVAGGFIGYDQQVTPNIVIGAQAEFNAAASDDFAATGTAGTVRLDPRYSFDITARAGYLVTPKTLLYVRGGYANERVRTTITTAKSTLTSSENRDGWLLGAGAERMITPNLSARLEYRYADFGKNGGKFDRHQVLVGAAYRF